MSRCWSHLKLLPLVAVIFRMLVSFCQALTSFSENVQSKIGINMYCSQRPQRIQRITRNAFWISLQLISKPTMFFWTGQSWRIANDFCAVSQTDLLVTRHLVLSVVQITDAKLSHQRIVLVLESIYSFIYLWTFELNDTIPFI